ncbi:hypothetical protein [Tessaracoccus oleiagri]|nr:hypothetical protein [Tessaracoccus oleiagri]
MIRWLIGAAGGLLLLGLSFAAVIAATDVYASMTALRGEGIPGTVTITAREWSLPLDLFCSAEGRFVPDGGGPVVDGTVASGCPEPGTEVRAQYVPMLHDQLPLFATRLLRGTWGELGGACGFAILFSVSAVVAWWAAIRFLTERGVSEDRYGALQVASRCAEEDFVVWLEDNFDAAWLEASSVGVVSAVVAVIDGDTVVSGELDDLYGVGRSLADVGGDACVRSCREHVHVTDSWREEPRPWGPCSFQPEDRRTTRTVTVMRRDAAAGEPIIDGETEAVAREGWIVFRGDSASRNPMESHLSAAVLTQKGTEVSLALYEHGALMGRARWNNPGRLVGRRGSKSELRAICPTWPAKLWPTEMADFRMPPVQELEALLGTTGEPAEVISAAAGTFQLPAVDVLIGELTGNDPISSRPDAILLEPTPETHEDDAG